MGVLLSSYKMVFVTPKLTPIKCLLYVRPSSKTSHSKSQSFICVCVSVCTDVHTNVHMVWRPVVSLGCPSLVLPS